MFTAILRTQWKWTRGVALLAFILGFTLPLVSLFSLRATGVGFTASNAVREMQKFGLLYAVLAAGAGLTVAMLAWAHDHRGRHVYALSLPIPRSRYAAMRYGAGAIILLIPTLGVLIGSLVGLAVATIPAGLHGYPVALAIRFVLASFVAYSMIFAISASSTKSSSIILGTIAGIVVVVFLAGALGVGDKAIEAVVSALFADHGLLSVFTGRWMLIDV